MFMNSKDCPRIKYDCFTIKFDCFTIKYDCFASYAPGLGSQTVKSQVRYLCMLIAIEGKNCTYVFCQME